MSSPLSRRAFIGTLALAAGSPAFVRARADGTGALVFVGTYTGAKSQGIYAFRFDRATGVLSPAGLAAATKSPSFLAEHPERPWIFAVNEIDRFDGEKSGAVSGFAAAPPSPRLTRTNQVSSHGTGPCHLTVDAQGRFVYVANYGAGTLAVLPIGPDGRLQAAVQTIQHTGAGADKERQAGPHAHQVVFSPDGRYLLAVDLGLDKVLVYRVDPDKGTLTPNDPAFASITPASGPRHVAFAPSGRHACVINEMASTITVFEWDAARGALREIQQVSTLPAGFSGSSSTAEIAFHPSGRFLYGSNRGHDSIALFSVDAASGRLTFVSHTSTRGKAPRHFALDPDGGWLIAANQESDSLAVFRVDTDTGALQPAGDLVPVGAPVCVLFARAS